MCQPTWGATLATKVNGTILQPIKLLILALWSNAFKTLQGEVALMNCTEPYPKENNSLCFAIGGDSLFLTCFLLSISVIILSLMKSYMLYCFCLIFYISSINVYFLITKASIDVILFEINPVLIKLSTVFLIKGNKILHGYLKWTTLECPTQGKATWSSMVWEILSSFCYMTEKWNHIIIKLTCLSTFHPWYHQGEKEKWEAARQ